MNVPAKRCATPTPTYAPPMPRWRICPTIWRRCCRRTRRPPSDSSASLSLQDRPSSSGEAAVPRPKSPRRMQQHLDKILISQLERGTVRRLAGGEVVEVDLPASLLEVCRKRVADLGVSRPSDPDGGDPLRAAALRRVARIKAGSDEGGESPMAAKLRADWERREAEHAARTTPPKKPTTAGELAGENERLKVRLAALRAEDEGEPSDGW